MAPEWFEKTAHSQFLIAKYLQRHGDLAVFSEEVDADQSLSTASPDFLKLAERVRALFGGALGDDYALLTVDQRTVLAKAGGDAVALIFGYVRDLHRAVEAAAVEDEIIGKVQRWAETHPDATEYPPAVSDLIFNVRETLALEQVTNFFGAHPDRRDAILIFGSAHDFGKHPDKFPAECILSPGAFAARS